MNYDPGIQMVTEEDVNGIGATGPLPNLGQPAHSLALPSSFELPKATRRVFSQTCPRTACVCVGGNGQLTNKVYNPGHREPQSPFS